MQASRNERTATWHLIGARGCGADPDGDTISGTWAEIRDVVVRSEATRCHNCNWPKG
jgi:hypothetical protein